MKYAYILFALLLIANIGFASAHDPPCGENLGSVDYKETLEFDRPTVYNRTITYGSDMNHSTALLIFRILSLNASSPEFLYQNLTVVILFNESIPVFPSYDQYEQMQDSHVVNTSYPDKMDYNQSGPIVLHLTVSNQTISNQFPVLWFPFVQNKEDYQLVDDEYFVYNGSASKLKTDDPFTINVVYYFEGNYSAMFFAHGQSFTTNWMCNENLQSSKSSSSLSLLGLLGLIPLIMVNKKKKRS